MILAVERLSAPAAGLVLAVLTLIPAAVALVIPEPPPPRRRAREEFIRLWLNLREGLRVREIREGIIIFLCPSCASTMTFLFSGLATDYRAGAGVIAFANGPGGGLLTMAGALAGGAVAQRLGSRRGYALLGLTGGVTALAMALPRSIR
jgi:hypothetical protein